MKKSHFALATLTAAATVIASLPIAQADSGVYTYYPTVISANGSPFYDPGHIASKDILGGPNAAVTSFLPIYYINEVLAKYGITTNWNGTTGVLNLTTPSDGSITVNYPPTPTAPTGTAEFLADTMQIQINGKVVTYAPRIAWYDEGSNGIVTTFIPVWYIQKSLGYMGITCAWDGTTWSMEDSNINITPPANSGTNMRVQAAISFAKAMGIQPDNSGVDQYSDVSISDWPMVHALTEDYVYNDHGGTFPMNAPLFTAQSGTTFGSEVTMTDIDRALQVAAGWTLGHDAYLPGGSLTAFMDLTGLDNGVTDRTGNLSQSEVNIMMANLAKIEKGYIALGNNQYQLVFRPQIPQNYWETAIPASVVAANEEQAIKLIDQTTVTYESGDTYVTKTPDLPLGSSLFIAGGGATPEQYSLDNGQTWHTASGPYGFTSSDANNGGTSNPPKYVLIKDTTGGGGVCVYALYDGLYETAMTGGIGNDGGVMEANYH